MHQRHTSLRSHARSIALLSAPWLVAACGGENRTEPARDAGMDAGMDARFDSGGDAHGDAAADGALDAYFRMDASPAWLPPVPLPDAPGPTDPARWIVVTAMTADSSANGDAEASGLDLCLTATRCFPVFRSNRESLDGRAYRERLPGGDNVYYVDLSGLAPLRRSDIDRVNIRHVDGGTWTPSCVDVSVDGVPVYCREIGAALGPPGEGLAQWSDVPRLDCGSCYAGPLGVSARPSPRGTITHGPMLGAVDDHSAILWVRADATRLVTVSIAHDEAMSDAVRVGASYPRARDDFTARFPIDGLAPATTYFYRIDVDGMPTTPVMRLRTAPAQTTGAPIRFILASCARRGTASGNVPAGPPFTNGDNRYQTFDKLLASPGLAASDLDFFVYTGDIHYGNTTALEDLRWNFRATRGDRTLLHASISTLATWDDHDFGGNNADSTTPGRTTSARVFNEYFAQLRPSGASQGIYTSHRYGDIEVFLLDTRYFRVPPDAMGRGGRMLGAAQTTWFLDAIARSTATFKLIVSGSSFSSASQKAWSPFLVERDALFDAIAARGIEGVVLASGGPHRSEIRRVPRARGYTLYEFIASPLSASSSPCPTGDSASLRCVGQQTLPDGGVGEEMRSYVLVEVNGAPGSRQLVARIIAEGASRDVTEPLSAFMITEAMLR